LFKSIERLRELVNMVGITIILEARGLLLYTSSLIGLLRKALFEREMCPWAISKYFGD
jgi:hypothetical protein